VRSVETRAELQAAVGERYRLDRELGRGGMAIVWLARDLRLDCDVAIKFLPPELARVLGTERFQREVRFAASLSHPHILPAFDTGGELSGRLWYAMPYVAGESLRDRINREKQLPVDAAVAITVQVASALAFAHSHGILHRDIKPENILLVEGEAVVADFGIARALDAAGGSSLTETGLAIGTTAYMSPEQCTASPDIDGRSDVYSLGCVLYEMLAGEPPHTGVTPQAIIAKRMTTPAPSIRVVREGIPPAIDAAIQKALARSPADRFPSAAALADALKAASSGTSALPASASYSSHRLVGIAATVVFLGLGAVVARRFLGYSGATADSRTLAVLPFRVTGPDPDNMGESMVDLLTANLSGAAGLRLVSAQTVLSRSKRDLGVGAASADEAALLGVARQVGARHALTGSVVRIGGELRLIAEVYDAGSGKSEGRAEVSGASDSLSVLVDRLSENLIKSSFLGRIEGVTAPSLARVTSTSLPALKHYLAGEQKFRAARAPEAISEFQAAVELDSTFALALYRLSLVKGWSVSPHSLGAGTPDYAAQAARHASRLPPREAALTQALVLMNNGMTESIDSLKAFVALYPQDAEGWFLLGDAAFHLGGAKLEPRETFRQALRRSIELDPDFGPAYLHLTEDAFDRQDSAMVRQNLAALRRIDPSSDKATGIGLAWALVWGDSGEQRRARAAMDTMSGFALITAKHVTNTSPDLWQATLEVADYVAGQRRLPDSVRALGHAGGSWVRAARGHIAESEIPSTPYMRTLGLPTSDSLPWRLGDYVVYSVRGMPISKDSVVRAYDELLSLPDSNPLSPSLEMLEVAAAEKRQQDLARITQYFRTERDKGPPSRGRVLTQVIALSSALTAEQNGDRGAVIRTLEVSLPLMPGGAGSYESQLRYQLAKRLADANEFDKARQYLESFDISDYFPNPAGVQLLLGQVYEGLNRPEDAREAYAKVVRWWRDADPEFKPSWEHARERLAALTKEPKQKP
jgi:tetratricopeptide (TPR) repeat protein